VIRRGAPQGAAVQSAVGEDAAAESRFGWEMQTLRLLSRAMTRDQGDQ
jgi:hypothetical protein